MDTPAAAAAAATMITTTTTTNSSSRRSCKYECSVWQQDDLIRNNQSYTMPNKAGFFIQFLFHWIVERGYVLDQNSRVILQTAEELFFATRPFQFYDDAWKIMSPTLSTLGVPISEQEWMIRRISSFAYSRDPNCKVIPLAVEVGLVMFAQEEDNTMDWDVMESMQLLNSRPATKLSIKALEKVRLGAGAGSSSSCSMMGECTICLEDFSAGLQVTRMPCSHVYHENCIVRWLGMSHLCPVCRFPMPSE